MDSYSEPATAQQKRKIAQLCQALHIKEALEERPMTLGEAGILIRELSARVKVMRNTGIKLPRHHYNRY